MAGYPGQHLEQTVPIPSKDGAYSEDNDASLRRKFAHPQQTPGATAIQYPFNQQPQPAASAPPLPPPTNYPQPSASAPSLPPLTNYPAATQYPSQYPVEAPPPYSGPVSYPQYSAPATGPWPAIQPITQERVIVVQPTEEKPRKRKEALFFASITSIVLLVLLCWWALPFTLLGIALARMDHSKGYEGVSIGCTAFGIVAAVTVATVGYPALTIFIAVSSN